MEQALAAASAAGLKVLIVRCGDVFGPAPGNNWLSQGLVQPGKPIAAVRYPGPLAIAHSWAYLPDVAETVLRLLALPDLEDFAVFHMRGHTRTGAEFIAGLEAAAGHRLKVLAPPWLVIRAMAPFVEALREMIEMKYLWDEPVLLDNAKLRARLGAEPRTPLVEALQATLAGIGSLPQRETAMAA
jgi:nucleoside-diphosphate-sugar epimerase